MIQSRVPDRLLGVALDEFIKRLQLKGVDFLVAHVHQVDDDEQQKDFELTLQFEIQLPDKTSKNTTCHMGRDVLLNRNVDAIMRRAGGMTAIHLWREIHALPTTPQD